MRISEVRVGETYWVEVPHNLPAARYRTDVVASWIWPACWALRGCWFPLTITDGNPKPGSSRPMVQGMRTVQTSEVMVDLTEDQALQLGLPTEHGYSVLGLLCDTDGEPVAVPEVETILVPARWLHLMTVQRPPTHRDATGQLY